MTPRKIIYAAFRLVGVLRAGQTPSADKTADAFDRLNGLLDSWSTERLLCRTLQRTEHPAGSTIVLNQAPVRIEAAAVMSGAGETPIAVFHSHDEWLLGKPGVWCDRAYPVSTLHVRGYSDGIVLYAWRPVAAFSALDDIYALPPGWQIALEYGLAVAIAPQCTYDMKTANVLLSDLRVDAADYKSKIKALNVEPIILGCDPGLRSAGHYDITRDGF